MHVPLVEVTTAAIMYYLKNKQEKKETDFIIYLFLLFFIDPFCFESRMNRFE